MNTPLATEHQHGMRVPLLEDVHGHPMGVGVDLSEQVIGLTESVEVGVVQFGSYPHGGEMGSYLPVGPTAVVVVAVRWELVVLCDSAQRALECGADLVEFVIGGLVSGVGPAVPPI